MTRIYVTPTVPAADCIAAGFPNPDVDPTGWIEAVRYSCAAEIELGLDIDDANTIIRLAIARADYVPPERRVPYSPIEIEILEELAA